MTNSSESLEQQFESVVERLVREHLAILEAAASAAVREGFPRATRLTSKQRDGASARRRRGDGRARGGGAGGAVCAHPGETMTVLARAPWARLLVS